MLCQDERVTVRGSGLDAASVSSICRPVLCGDGQRALNAGADQPPTAGCLPERAPDKVADDGWAGSEAEGLKAERGEASRQFGPDS